MTSVTVAPVTAVGPALVAVMVYVTFWPQPTPAVPFDLVMRRFANVAPEVIVV